MYILSVLLRFSFQVLITGIISVRWKIPPCMFLHWTGSIRSPFFVLNHGLVLLT